MTCSCPDWAVPCKHVAAVHYALAAELDRDPFLLFRLRGRTREELTAALRARRGSFGSAGAARMAEIQAAEAEAAPAQPLPIDQFWTLGPELEGLHFEIRGPDVPGAVLRLLGRPPGWGGQEELQATLHDLYRVASASVRDVALADLEAPAEESADAAEASGDTTFETEDGATATDGEAPAEALSDGSVEAASATPRC